MSTKVRVNSLAIKEFRKAKGLSRQAVSNAAKNNNLNISRPTIERLESAQKTDSFLYEKVKILPNFICNMFWQPHLSSIYIYSSSYSTFNSF